MDASLLFSPSGDGRVIRPFPAQPQPRQDALATPWPRLSKQQQQRKVTKRAEPAKSLVELTPIAHRNNASQQTTPSQHEPQRRQRSHIQHSERLQRRKQQQLQALEDETRIYGGSALSTPAAAKPKLQRHRTDKIQRSAAVNPLLPRQIEHERRQEATLARSLELKIDRMGLAIPVAFLLERQHVAFAERVVLTAMCKALTRHYSRAVHASFAVWKRQTTARRVLADHARHVQLLRQTSLAHACAIVQRKQQLRMRACLQRWLQVALAIRAAEHNQFACVLQRCWRRYALLVRFRWLAQAYRDHVRHESATRIQSLARNFLARRQFQELVAQHRRHLAAQCVQRCYRNYQIRKIAHRQRQREAALVLQRCWRGHTGRRRVARRRQLTRQAAETVYLSSWRQIALARVEFLWTAVTKLQRCVRAYFVRCRVASAAKRNQRRRVYWPVSRVQRAWRTYRENQIGSAISTIVNSIVETNECAAMCIQRAFARFLTRKRHRCALVLTALFRCFRARKIVMRSQLAWLETWTSSFFTRWRCDFWCRRSERWSLVIQRLQTSLDELVENQQSALRRLNTVSGCRLLVVVKRFHLDFEAFNASIAQNHWRWRHFQIAMREKVRAARQLHKLLPVLFRSYKRRQRRRVVLGRWKRQRFVEMKAVFQQWRAFHRLVCEAKALRVSNESLRRVKWFRHQKLRKRMVQGWKVYIAHRHESLNKRRMADALAALHIKRRAWRAWAREQLPELTVANRLREMKTLLHCWHQWTLYCVHQRKTKRAIAWRQRRLQQLSVSTWICDMQDMKRDLELAQQHNDRAVLKRTLSVFHRYVGFLKQVDESCRKQRYARGVRQWILHMCRTHQTKAWATQSRSFCKQHAKQKCWRQWTRYIRHRRAHRLQMTQMDAFRARKQLRTATARWQERVLILKDLHFTTSLAIEFHRLKLLQQIFQRGFFQFWAETIGARRIHMATRIQRLVRSKRARKKLFVLRTKLTYQIESRVSKGLDVVEFTTETLLESLKSRHSDKKENLWVFALVSYPWKPVSGELQEMFSTVATNWRYLRRTRTAFGTISATSSVSSDLFNGAETEHGDDDDEEDAHTAYSLLSWLGVDPQALPCIVAFWQGMSVNAAALLRSSGSRRVKRRFERVCGEAAGPSLVFQLVSTTGSVLSVMEWIETLQRASQEATAVDLQAYARAFLAKRVAQSLREAKCQAAAGRIQHWFRALLLKWRTKKRNRAALKLQRWHHGIVKRRLLWRTFQASMAQYRSAKSAIRGFSRRYFARKRFKLLCACLVATPERFPNAPLCEECFGSCGESEGKKLELATLKCRDCTQALCASCFTALHRSGKRMLHLANRIEVRAMDDPSASMCDGCEVAACKKLCGTCKAGSSDGIAAMRSRGFCASCFERAHGERSAGDNRRSKKSWWESQAFKSHEWTRAVDSPSRLLTAADIVAKYQWTTLAQFRKQQQEALERERSEKGREDELFAIRMQHEAILRDAFERYDSDHSGSIDRREFACMFKEELCQPLREDQIDAAMRAMDRSGDGLIQFDELLAWFAEGVRDNSATVASQASELLKDALRAKRSMRRYKEKLSGLLPPVGSTIKDRLSVLSPPSSDPGAALPPAIPKVPGFPSVDCLELRDYVTKRKVFFRFLKEICGIEWVEEDEAIIPVDNARDVFANVFLPRWNAGELTFDFYFDDEVFEFEGSQWKRQWDAQRRKYVYHTQRKRQKQKASVGVTENDESGKRRKSKRGSTSARRKSSRKSSQAQLQREEGSEPGMAREKEEEQEELEEVVEAIDPRRKQLLFEQAKRAFATADTDASGFIDAKEFHHLLANELCEPISRAKAGEVMNQIDFDRSGKIDFDEFFLWYATDKCQDYPTTPQMERVRAILKTRRRARATALAAVGAGVSGGLKVKRAIEESMRASQLNRDCKGASAELVTLLCEGFPKLLASKALSLHQQNVELARSWLEEKQQEEQHEKDVQRKERADRKLLQKRVAQEAARKRKKRVAGVKRTMKLLFFGVDKKEAHAAKVDDALQNLEREILLVDQHLSSKLLVGKSASKSSRRMR